MNVSLEKIRYYDHQNPQASQQQIISVRASNILISTYWAKIVSQQLRQKYDTLAKHEMKYCAEKK
jgi:hypothetical protein